MKFQQIRLDKLNFSSPQIRTNLRENLDDLKTSIENQGILLPILIRKSGKEYIIIDGNRRVMALEKLRKSPSTLVPAFVVAVNDTDSLKLEMITNLVRKNFSPLEEAEVVNLLINSYKMKQEEVAKALGKTQARISQLTAIFKLPKEVLSALRREKISIQHARVLTKYQNDPELIQKILRKILKEKISSEDIASIAYLMSKRGKSSIPIFSPIVEKYKDGSKIKIEPGKKTIEVKLSISPERDLDSILHQLKRKYNKILQI